MSKGVKCPILILQGSDIGNDLKYAPMSRPKGGGRRACPISNHDRYIIKINPFPDK